MQMIQETGRSLGFLIGLTWDRIAPFLLLAFSLAMAAYVASVVMGNPFIL